MTGEQLAANVSGYGTSLLNWVRGLPRKTVHNALCGLLALWILLILLQMISVLLPSSSAVQLLNVPAESTASLARKSRAVDLVKLQSFNLFGDVSAQQVPKRVVGVDDVQVLQATKTKLNLSLEGIVHAALEEQSVAVIVIKGKQEQFYIGDKLPVGGRVILRKIFPDHIILDNSGKYESLWLYDEEKKSATTKWEKQQSAPRSTVTDQRNNSRVTGLAADYRQRLYKNPGTLAEVLRIAPALEDGEMKGYRVSPGKDRQQFSQLGFKNNDVVTSVNGIELNEPSNALEVYKLMRTATEASFTVQRNGEALVILVSLNES